jgi:hypothetical protein
MIMALIAGRIYWDQGEQEAFRLCLPSFLFNQEKIE